jgi:hypothetical protein
MTNLPLSFNSCADIDYTPTSFLMRVGRREMLVCRDYRNRYYNVNPLVDISTGIEAGHLEILLFRKWLVILSKSR